MPTARSTTFTGGPPSASIRPSLDGSAVGRSGKHKASASLEAVLGELSRTRARYEDLRTQSGPLSERALLLSRLHGLRAAAAHVRATIKEESMHPYNVDLLVRSIMNDRLREADEYRRSHPKSPPEHTVAPAYRLRRRPATRPTDNRPTNRTRSRRPQETRSEQTRSEQTRPGVTRP